MTRCAADWMTAARVDDAELHVHLTRRHDRLPEALDARRKRSARAMEGRSVITERVDSAPDEHIRRPGGQPLPADQRGEDSRASTCPTVSVAIDWKSSP